MNSFAEKIQRYFGVNLAYIIRGGFWLGLDQVLAAAVSFILSVAFANLISQEAYGTYRYVLSFFSILTITTLPNMGIATISYVARGFEGLLFQALKMRVRWGVFGSLISLGIGVYYTWQGNGELAPAFFLMAAFLPFIDPLSSYGAYLEGKKLFRLRAELSILVRIVSAGALIGTMALTENLLWILLAYFLPYLIIHPIFFLLTIKKFPPNQQVDVKMISYGKQLSALQLLGVAVNYFDNLLIFNSLGAASLAVYSIANAPISKLQLGFSVLSDLALPKFSEKPVAEVRRWLGGKILKVFLVVALAVATYIFAAPYLFNWLLPKYVASIFYTQLLSLGLLAWPFGLIYTFLQAHAFKQRIYQYNLAIRIVQLILISVLVYWYGILGAVAARLLFQAFSVFTLLFLFSRTQNSEAAN